MIWLVIKVYQSPEPELISVIYFAVIGCILCEVYSFYIKRQIGLTVAPLSDHLNKSEKVTLKITVYNRSFLPAPYIYIFLKESYHIVPNKIKCLCVTLPPHSHKEYTFNMTAAYSGKEGIGIEKVVVSDFLELARRTLNYSWLQEVVVLPQPFIMKGADYLLNYTSVSRNEKTDAKQMVLMEQGEVSYELKPYVEGQSQRLIHWKLAAQRDIYMVREREQIIKLRRMRLVVIDPVVIPDKLSLALWKRLIKEERIQSQWEMKRRDAKLKDKLVNGTASYLLEVLKMGESILLIYYDQDKWKQVKLEVRQDLENISDQLSSCMIGCNKKPDRRWPEVPQSSFSQKILITAGADAALRTAVEEESGLKILELQKRSVLSEEDYEKYWYLTDDYQMVRNG